MIDIDYIQELIQEILNNTFTHPAKRKIKRNSRELNFACPICGDSAKNMAEKRGHLYFNSLRYRCYNEGCKQTVTSLCKRYNVAIDPAKKGEFVKFIDEHVAINSANSDEFILSSLDKLIGIDDMVAFFNEGNDMIKGLSRVRPRSRIYDYLKGRKIPDYAIDRLYEGMYRVTDTWWEPVVIMVNTKGDKVLGLQVRNTKDDKKRRLFKIHTFQDLYGRMYPESTLDDIEAAGYNKIGSLYNFFNIDLERKITVFEGMFDSTFYPNSISTAGINTDLSILFDNDIDSQFFLDNDRAGKMKSLALLEQGHSVFLWDKLMYDQSRASNMDYYVAREVLMNIKDLNQLAMHVENPYKTLNLSNYFSRDIYDKRWISIPPKTADAGKTRDDISTLDAMQFKLRQMEYAI